jgi:hypothetical protein
MYNPKFEIGDIVECIDDSNNQLSLSKFVKIGDVFIVRDVGKYVSSHYRDKRDEGPEIIKFDLPDYIDLPYYMTGRYWMSNWRFKLVAKKTKFGYVIQV